MCKIKVWLRLGVFALSIALYGCAGEPFADNVATDNKATDKSGTVTELKIIDNKVGSGAQAKHGDTVKVHYTGWLYDAAAPDHKGKKFDSSLDRGEVSGILSFYLGSVEYVKGWNQGIMGMQVGGERTLIVPSELAYGARGKKNTIPPNTALVFEIKLLGIR